MLLLVLEAFVGFICLCAGLSQLVINRSDDSNLHILQTARRLTGISLLIAGSYILYALIEFGYAHPVLCLVVGLLALGQILFAMHTAFEPSSTDRLMGKAEAPPVLQRKRRGETSHA